MKKLRQLCGLSLMVESPVEAGVPAQKPLNEFFESDRDVYFVVRQLSNGVRMKINRRLYFKLDGKIGPAYCISDRSVHWNGSVDINLGIPFD